MRLYNLLEDPEEKKNLSRKEREIMKRFEMILQMWFDVISGKKLRYDVGNVEFTFTLEELKKLRSLGYFK